MPVAVIGIGQGFRGDDAAGLDAVRLWQSTHADTADRPDVTVACLEGSGLDLLEILQDVDAAVLVDAVSSGAPAGSVRIIREAELTGRTNDGPAGHGWGIPEVLRLATALLPDMDSREVRLLGIEAGTLGEGRALSSAVEAALPALSEAIEEQVLSLLRS